MKPIFSPQLPRLPKRALDAHKTAAGTVCVIGGSYGMAGAAALAASGALVAGAGYVRVVCPDDIYTILAVLVPSAVFVPLNFSDKTRAKPDLEAADAAIRASTACVVGPGLGNSPCAEELLLRVAAADKPAVIDADALNLLGANPRALANGRPKWVLTPHPGEAGHLLKTDSGTIQADRPAAAARLAALGCVAVLKGARTLVCDSQRLYENASGNAGMAKAGSGDVLAGVIGALLAQGVNPFDAACLGVFLHGKAGDKAAARKGRGLTAHDILKAFPAVLLEYEKGAFEAGKANSQNRISPLMS